MVDAGAKGDGSDDMHMGGATGDGDSEPPATTGDGTDGPPPADGTDGTDGTTDGTDGTTDGTDGTTDGTDGTTDGTDGTTDGTDGNTEPDAGSGTPQCPLNSPVVGDGSGCSGNRTLSAVVWDLVNDQPLQNVTIHEDTCGDAQLPSDFDGSFTITVPDSGSTAFLRMHLDGYEPGLSEFFTLDPLPDSFKVFMVPSGTVDSYRGACQEPVLVAQAFDVNSSAPISGLTFGDAFGADTQYPDASLGTATSGPTGDSGIAVISGDALTPNAPAADDVSASNDAGSCIQNQSDTFPFEIGYVTAAQILMNCN